MKKAQGVSRGLPTLTYAERRKKVVHAAALKLNERVAQLGALRDEDVEESLGPMVRSAGVALPFPEDESVTFPEDAMTEMVLRSPSTLLMTAGKTRILCLNLDTACNEVKACIDLQSKGGKVIGKFCIEVDPHNRSYCGYEIHSKQVERAVKLFEDLTQGLFEK